MLLAVFSAFEMALVSAAAADRVPVPPTAPIEHGEYRAREVGGEEDLWRHEWVVVREARGGATILRAEQHGHGRRGRSAPTRWSGDLQMTLRGDAYRLSSRREVRDALGTLLEVEERELDSATGVGRITIVDAALRRTSLRSVRVARNTIDIEMLPVEMRLLPARADQRMRIDVVTDDGAVVGMEATIVGRERIAVPAGVFDCYRIDLRPTGFLGALAGLMLPRFSMWHTVAAPHAWIRYRGPASGVGSPEILRELTRFRSRDP